MTNKLALLIDADNINSDLALQIFDKIASLGEAITKRAFGNISVFSGQDGWKEPVRQYAIEAFPQVSNIDRKNTADFSLIINAMDCLASGKYDGFVLASSDSDFTSLAQRLRNDNKLVYGMGDERATISFRSACTQFFELTRPCSTCEVINTPLVAEPVKVVAEPVKVVAEPVKAPAEAPTLLSTSCPSVSPIQNKQPTVSSSMVDVPASASAKIPTEFERIVADLQKQKCKKLVALQHALMNLLRKPEEGTKKIIKAMKSQGYISIDENNRITWLDKQ